MARRVLITGASGLLGRALYREFRRPGNWEVLGLAFSRASGELKAVDLKDKQAVDRVIQEFKPSIIIHSAAERRPDVVEKQEDATRQLNIEATRYLCEAAGDVGAWVLYISTDYVFDGTKPPYKTTDEPNPLNKYGVSKLEGEKVTFEVSRDNGILRLPILFSEVKDLEESAVTCLFPKVKDTSKPCVMSDYERRFPTNCDDVAYVVRQLAEKRLQDKSIKGIFHWSGDENMTKYDMAVTMATAFGIPTNHIQADKTPSTGAKRPFNSQLDSSRLEQMGIVKRTKFAEEIKKVLSPFFP